MIRYPFLNDQVLITNPRNGMNVVLSRDEARQLYEQLGRIDMEPDAIEAVAEAIYKTAPTCDQETDLDGRCVGPAYEYTWQDVKDSLPATYEAACEAATLALRAYYSK